MSKQTGPSIDSYPIVRKGTPISFKFKYNISQRSGISFATERLDAFTIIRDDDSPYVKNILSSTSLNYIYSFEHNKHELTSGISVMFHRMKADYHGGSTSFPAETKRFGINFGYSYHLL